MQSDRPTSTRVAEAVARGFFKTELDPASLKKSVRRWLFGIVWSAILVPSIFLLRFGEVGPVGLGLTIFFCVYCLVSATGLYFLVRPEYHTPVVFKNDWIDRIGAFWLVACALGPFIGWALAAAFTLTSDNWRWVYWVRLGFSIGLPLLTGFPLIRYVRGQGAPLMLALLLGITGLPVWSGWNTVRDLAEGPDDLFLVHTERRLK